MSAALTHPPLPPPRSAFAGLSAREAIAAARRQKRGTILYPRLIVLAGTWWRQTAPGAELQKLEVQNG